jgi:adenylylsulfate kinase-like enzyme
MGTAMTDSKYSDIICKEYLFDALEVDRTVGICRIVLVAPNNAKNGIMFLTLFFSSYRQITRMVCQQLIKHNE